MTRSYSKVNSKELIWFPSEDKIRKFGQPDVTLEPGGTSSFLPLKQYNVTAHHRREVQEGDLHEVRHEDQAGLQHHHEGGS